MNNQKAVEILINQSEQIAKTLIQIENKWPALLDENETRFLDANSFMEYQQDIIKHMNLGEVKQALDFAVKELDVDFQQLKKLPGQHV